MPTTGDEAPGSGDDPRLHLLTHGRLEVHDLLPDASNTSVRATVRLGTRAVSCVYKPVSGERPLWDFPDGTLARRETAAYLLRLEEAYDAEGVALGSAEKLVDEVEDFLRDQG